MSIDYCSKCEIVLEGDEENIELKTHEDGTAYQACALCGEEITGLPEDDPKEDR